VIAKKKVRKRKKRTKEREIVYPEIEVSICKGEDAITGEQAKELLGWVEEDDLLKFGADYLLKDTEGNKIRCHYGNKNRYLTKGNWLDLKQEILHKHWKLNGETIVVGQYREVLNGNHSLIGLILAIQEWRKNPDKYPWDEEPTLEKIIVFGISEDDATINTIDTAKSRTISEVIYRSHFFQDKPKKDRKRISRICSFAINTVWERTGAEHAFAPRRTHSEALHFLDRHPKLLEAVYHIYVEDVEGSISRYLPPGYAAGLLYLMGCSNSDPDAYLADPEEDSLDWMNWDSACNFFVLISSKAKISDPLRKALGDILEDEQGGTRKERIALVIKGWESWIDSGKIGSPKLKYKKVDGIKILDENPSVGGIDLLERETL